MRKLIFIFILLPMFLCGVHATQFEPPPPPDGLEQYVPEDTLSFWDSLLLIMGDSLERLRPSLNETLRMCLSVLAACVMLAMLSGMSGNSKRIIELAGTVGICTILIQPTNAMIHFGTDIISQMAEYGKLLIPVMTAAMAAQCATTTSAALYTGTTIFLQILTNLISKGIVPMLYAYICLCIADRAIKQEILSKLKETLKWLMTWSLKILLYLFTAFISITGVVSGTVDSSVIKATKLTISGVVPVVGGIISDASEAVIIGASTMKNAAGLYGMIVILGLCISPFLQIGSQYLLLKATAALCSVCGTKATSGILSDFTAAMGFVLAMMATVCVLLLLSIVCFMKGVSI